MKSAWLHKSSVLKPVYIVFKRLQFNLKELKKKWKCLYFQFIKIDMTYTNAFRFLLSP